MPPTIRFANHAGKRFFFQFYNHQRAAASDFGKGERLVGLENPVDPRGTSPHGGLQTVQPFAFTKEGRQPVDGCRTKKKTIANWFANRTAGDMLREL